MNKQFLAVIVVVFLALFGIFALTGDDKASNETSSTGDTNSGATEHTAGKLDSAVTLVEYGDFQCPACKSYYPIFKELKNEYGDRVKFQFRHFPLVQIHPNAFIASRAAEAAGKQGKFFEMHDLLYENQSSWQSASPANSFFESYAQQLNLNMDQFKADSASSSAADAINADIKAGQALKANSTPTFILNGQKIEKNPQSYDEFKKLLDDELAKNQ